MAKKIPPAKPALTVEEMEAADQRCRLMCDLINCRKAAHLTQEQLALRAGYSRPTVARIENSTSDPPLSTLLELLLPLGMTLEIVPIKKKERWKHHAEALYDLFPVDGDFDP